MAALHRVESTIRFVTVSSVFTNCLADVCGLGDVFSLNLAGQPVLVVNSIEAASDLFGEIKLSSRLEETLTRHSQTNAPPSTVIVHPLSWLVRSLLVVSSLHFPSMAICE